MPTDHIVLVGAGGHARVVLDAARRAFPATRIRIFDESPRGVGTLCLGLPVEHPFSWPAAGEAKFHVAIGDNRARRRLALAGLEQGLSFCTLVHPGATIAADAVIGPGAFVAAQAIVAPAVMVGTGAILNHGAIVDHDNRIGEFSHIAPGAVLGGGVTIGALTLIGARAVVLPGVTIGDAAVIGAGAVVTRNVDAGQTVVGIPARARTFSNE